MATGPSNSSFLTTPRGRLTLALLCGVAFLDFVDASIINIALPAIRRDLHVSVQNLQWVPSTSAAARSRPSVRLSSSQASVPNGQP